MHFLLYFSRNKDKSKSPQWYFGISPQSLLFFFCVTIIVCSYSVFPLCVNTIRNVSKKKAPDDIVTLQFRRQCFGFLHALSDQVYFMEIWLYPTYSCTFTVFFVCQLNSFIYERKQASEPKKTQFQRNKSQEIPSTQSTQSRSGSLPNCEAL